MLRLCKYCKPSVICRVNRAACNSSNGHKGFINDCRSPHGTLKNEYTLMDIIA